LGPIETDPNRHSLDVVAPNAVIWFDELSMNEMTCPLQELVGAEVSRALAYQLSRQFKEDGIEPRIHAALLVDG
jgi:hypothetical protein